MRRISKKRAMEIAYKNLYESEVEKIDKNLDAFLKAKKYISRTED